MKRLLSIAVPLIISLSLLFCTRSPDNRLSFAVGGAPAELDFWQALSDTFTARTGIEIDLIRQPTDTDQRRQSLVTSLSSRKAQPDVFLMDVAWIAQFAASKWLHPLDQLMVSATYDTVFFDTIVGQVDRYDNTLVALPVYIDGGMLYYREDLLKKYNQQVPQTWQDLVATSRKIMTQQRKVNPRFYGFVWQGAQYEGLVCTFLEFAGSHGGGIEITENAIRVNTEQNREALKLMKDFIHGNAISPPNTYTEMKEEEVRTFFQNGNALFERNWPYAWKLHNEESSPVAENVGIAPLPHFPGGRSVATLGGWHVGISPFSRLKKEAWQFVAFITSYETQKKLALELGWNPGRKDVYQDTEVLKYMPHFKTLRDAFTRAIARPNVPYYTYISKILQHHLNSALAEKTSVDKALADAEKEMQDAFEQYAVVP